MKEILREISHMQAFDVSDNVHLFAGVRLHLEGGETKNVAYAVFDTEGSTGDMLRQSIFADQEGVRDYQILNTVSRADGREFSRMKREYRRQVAAERMRPLIDSFLGLRQKD